MKATFVVRCLAGKWYVIQLPAGHIVPASSTRVDYKSADAAHSAAAFGRVYA
jgi:hypothetical protein